MFPGADVSNITVLILAGISHQVDHMDNTAFFGPISQISSQLDRIYMISIVDKPVIRLILLPLGRQKFQTHRRILSHSLGVAALVPRALSAKPQIYHVEVINAGKLGKGMPECIALSTEIVEADGIFKGSVAGTHEIDFINANGDHNLFDMRQGGLTHTNDPDVLALN